jgi:hypothetical protein
MQYQRKAGQNIPASCREPETLQYKKICEHGKNLKRYIDLFPSDSILVLFFDDFVKSPQSAYRNVLEFLDLDDDGRTDFPKVNESKHHKRRWLAKWLISPPGIFGLIHAKLRRFIATTDSDFIKSVEKSARKLAAINSSKKTSCRLSEREFSSILSELNNDIDLLASLTGKDLSHWKSASL